MSTPYPVVATLQANGAGSLFEIHDPFLGRMKAIRLADRETRMFLKPSREFDVGCAARIVARLRLQRPCEAAEKVVGQVSNLPRREQ